MRDERINEGGVRDDRAIKWLDKNILAGTGFAHFDRRNAGLLCLQISTGFSQDIIQGMDTLMKCSDRLRDTEVTWKQAGSR